MRNWFYLSIGLIYLGFSSCIPNKPKSNLNFFLDLEDKEIQMAFEAGYNHSRDSLLTLFHHKNPTIRYIAVNAFASWPDTTVIDSIAPLLKDVDENVRIGAAYSLGQMRSLRSEPYLKQSFVKFDSLNNNQLFNATILESLGKCGSIETLKLIAGVKSYLPTDSVLVAGQSRSLYRFALRDMIVPEGTKTCLHITNTLAYPYEARLYAANYLSKGKGIDLKGHVDTLIHTFNLEKNPNIQKALALAISKTKTEKVFNFIQDELSKSNNPSIRYILINNIQTFPYVQSDTIAFLYIKDPDYLIARSAAQYLMHYGNPEDSKKYFECFLDPATNKSAHIELLGAANKHTPYTFSVTKSTINNILKDSLLNVPDVYRKTDIIEALSYDVTNFMFIRNVTEKSPDKALQVVGLESFGNILGNPYFQKVYRSNYIPYKKLIFSYLIDGILSKDVGLVSTAAMVLRNPELNFKTFFPSDSLFRIAQRKQKLPENVEAYNELAKTISYWSGQPYKPGPDKGFRMMDWAVLNNITDSTTCTIITGRGTIKIQLLPSVAPMTVANWVELLKRNYYNNKSFHRVVPNFVIQNGCNRGDGFGALNYTIRSEFTQVYYDHAGFVGMASAGPDTESAQFFITSSATPHLDGRYTIFAKVISGMDVVNKIRKGDKILKINIK